MMDLKTQFSLGHGGLLPQEELLAIRNQKRSMSIGIPKEEDGDEARIALTPQAVEQLVNNDFKILIEREAGKGSNFTDQTYSEFGATIVNSKKEVYECDVILKVAPFKSDEIKLLKEKQLVISSVIVNPDTKETIQELIDKKVNAIGFEYMRDLEGNYPVVQSLCEIAGKISIMISAEYLSNVNHGKGVMMGGVTGISPTEVVILGANMAGYSAARIALGMGATVKIFDNYLQRLIDIQHKLGQNVFTSNYHPPVLRKALRSAEVVIGAVQLVEEEQVFYVPEDMIEAMEPGAILIDLSIDQGGCFETSHRTNHSNPVFTKHGVTHYCVPNITSRVARTSSIALSNLFTPTLLKIGEYASLESFLQSDFTVRQGMYIYKGILTNRYISNYFNIPYRNIDLLMSAF